MPYRLAIPHCEYDKHHNTGNRDIVKHPKHIFENLRAMLDIDRPRLTDSILEITYRDCQLYL
jgi:hypothetical protein